MVVSLPAKSILLDTAEILQACEQAEISSRNVNQTQYVLVTELACLLVLGEYQHARHLWHRYRDDCPGIFHTVLTQEFEPQEGQQRMEPAVDLPEELADLYQFFVLWHLVAKPMLLYQSNHVFANVRRILSACKDISAVQGPSSKLSFHEPLFTYVDEVVGTYQSKLLTRMEETYDTISESTLFASFSLEGEKTDPAILEDIRNNVQQRGWTLSTKQSNSHRIWVPASPAMLKRGEEETQGQFWNEEAMNSMIQTVAFLEKKLIM